MNLYRIIDFLELLQTLRTGKLRVPSAARFTDPNEMIGSLFAIMADPRSAPRTEDGIKAALDEQRAVRESNYVSCWTRVKDSIAMWEIYSPHRTAVQLEVDEDELHNVFNEHFYAHPFAKAHGTPPGFGETLFYPPNIGDCKYEDLARLSEKLRSQTRVNASYVANVLLTHGFDEFSKELSKVMDATAQDHLRLFFVKDHAYAHENEVRFCIQAVRRNGRPYEECKQDFGFVLFDTHLSVSRVADIGENIFINFPASVIRHAWLDGRAPSWQVDMQQELLRDYGVGVTQSGAYGAFPNRHPLDVWWDSHPA